MCAKELPGLRNLSFVWLAQLLEFYAISTHAATSGPFAHFLPSNPSKIESVPVTSLTFQRVVAISSLSHSDDCLVFQGFHFIQVPDNGELGDLDIDLLAYTCSTSLLRFGFLCATIVPQETEARTLKKYTSTHTCLKMHLTQRLTMSRQTRE